MDNKFKNTEQEPEEELLNKSVDEVVKKVSKFERLEIVDKLREIFLVRLRNEYHIAEMLRVGIDGNQITIEDAAKLLKDSKDGMSQLGTLLRLFEGESTSKTEVGVTVKHEDVEERLQYFARNN